MAVDQGRSKFHVVAFGNVAIQEPASVGTSGWGSGSGPARLAQANLDQPSIQVIADRAEPIGNRAVDGNTGATSMRPGFRCSPLPWWPAPW